MKNSEQLSFLLDFYRDRLALLNRHVEGAKFVSDYEFNNTYQYIIEREWAHVTWVRQAIEDVAGTAPSDNIPVLAVPGGSGEQRQAAIMSDDVAQMDAFHKRWKDRIATLPNARNRTMLSVILGEVLEHKRFFEQARAGNDKLLGTRMPGASTGDGVLPTRWIS